MLGDRVYVARGGWKTYSATAAATANAAAKQPRDAGRLYAALAAGTRQSTSVYDILALLRATTKMRRTGLTYRGVAALPRLARERTVAGLYARAPRGAVVGYALEMGQNLLPRQLVVTIRARDGRQWTYRTTYTGWAQGPPIAPPR